MSTFGCTCEKCRRNDKIHVWDYLKKIGLVKDDYSYKWLEFLTGSSDVLKKALDNPKVYFKAHTTERIFNKSLRYGIDNAYMVLDSIPLKHWEKFPMNWIPAGACTDVKLVKKLAEFRLNEKGDYMVPDRGIHDAFNFVLGAIMSRISDIIFSMSHNKDEIKQLLRKEEYKKPETPDKAFFLKFKEFYKPGRVPDYYSQPEEEWPRDFKDAEYKWMLYYTTNFVKTEMFGVSNVFDWLEYGWDRLVANYKKSYNNNHQKKLVIDLNLLKILGKTKTDIEEYKPTLLYLLSNERIKSYVEKSLKHFSCGVGFMGFYKMLQLLNLATWDYDVFNAFVKIFQ